MIAEIKKLYPTEFASMSDEKIQMLIDRAEMDIATFLHKKSLDEKLKKEPRVILATKMLVRIFAQNEGGIGVKKEGIKKYTQGAISVEYYDNPNEKKTSNTDEVFKILLPLQKVRVWS